MSDKPRHGPNCCAERTLQLSHRASAVLLSQESRTAEGCRYPLVEQSEDGLNILILLRTAWSKQVAVRGDHDTGDEMGIQADMTDRGHHKLAATLMPGQEVVESSRW